jgi:rubrerythrin
VVETMNRRARDLREEIQEKQIKPVAGIWSCPYCGRHIQMVLDSTVPERQPFICVCGTPMEPGEQHAELDTAAQIEGPLR